MAFASSVRIFETSKYVNDVSLDRAANALSVIAVPFRLRALSVFGRSFMYGMIESSISEL